MKKQVLLRKVYPLAVVLLNLSLTSCAPSNMTAERRSIASHQITQLEPRAAEAVVREFWSRIQQVSGSKDRQLLHSLSAGPALLAEEGELRYLEAVGRVVPPLPLNGVQVWVPRLTGYPAHFLARADTVALDEAGNLTSTPRPLLITFVKSDEASSWKAAYYVPVDPTNVPSMAVDPEGFILAADEASLAMRPGELSKIIASRENAHLDGRPDAGTLSSPPLSANLLRIRERVRQSDTSYDVRYMPSSQFGHYQYRMSDGGAVVVTVVMATVHVRAAAGRCLTSAGDDFPLVPRGAYAVVTTDILNMVAVSVSPTGGSPAKVIGSSAPLVRQVGESRRQGRSGLPHPVLC